MREPTMHCNVHGHYDFEASECPECAKVRALKKEEPMIEINSHVWVPRTKGGETLGQVRNIRDEQAYVTWDESVPSNIQFPMTEAMRENPCTRMVTATKGKWVPLASLRPGGK